MRLVKSYSRRKVFDVRFCPRKSLRLSTIKSAEELALCCGHVAAVNGGGHVAALNTLGFDNRVAPKRFAVTRLQFPGMRKPSYRNMSTMRNLSVTRIVAPKSAAREIRCARAPPVREKLRTRLRVIRPLNNSPVEGSLASASE